jgi:hypothetical protein
MKALFIAAALLSAAAVAPAFAQDSAPAAAPSATGLSAPPAGKGQVVFFRRSSMFGFPYWTNVRENGAAYGKLSNGVYFVQVLDPGVHEFDTSVLGKDAMKLQIDPGETYFVEGKIAMQIVGYTIVMAPSDEATFTKVKHSLKLAPPPEPDAPAK